MALVLVILLIVGSAILPFTARYILRFLGPLFAQLLRISGITIKRGEDSLLPKDQSVQDGLEILYEGRHPNVE